MGIFLFRAAGLAAGAAAALLVAGCTTAPVPPPTAGQTSCAAPQAGDALAGSWLSVLKQKGVAGELHVLFELRPDGGMGYSEQLKRGRQPPRLLSETGCWQSDGRVLTLRTLTSNGEPVEIADPIYTNQYTIVAQTGKALSLRGPDGALQARLMPPGYKLPF